MFNTTKIAKKIKEARIARNLTQMQLADAMGVSYQAVSNWERGNSLPDISKLEDLCQVLHLSIGALLGMENQETIGKFLTKKEPLTVEELSDLAPMLPPAEVKEQAQKQKLNLSALAGIAPFLDEDFLEELIGETEITSLQDIVGLAPFLDEDLLDALVRRAPKADQAGIIAVAPFLDEDTLDYLVKQCSWDQDRDFLAKLAPFLEEETVDALAQTQIDRGDLDSVKQLYPFMSEEMLHKIVKLLLAQGDADGLKEAAHFL